MASEPQLLRLWRLRLPHWLALPLCRLAGSCSSLKGLGSTALFLALSAAASGLSVHSLMALQRGVCGTASPMHAYVLPKAKTGRCNISVLRGAEHRGSLWVWTYGMVLGFLHGLILLAR